MPYHTPRYTAADGGCYPADDTYVRGTSWFHHRHTKIVSDNKATERGTLKRVEDMKARRNLSHSDLHPGFGFETPRGHELCVSYGQAFDNLSSLTLASTLLPMTSCPDPFNKLCGSETSPSSPFSSAESRKANRAKSMVAITTCGHVKKQKMREGKKYGRSGNRTLDLPHAKRSLYH
ncbi:hypothetical protein LX36DRAFT_81888 [Colletotrichum falcatum]|nr:hypothetical protein LX36DRAFT_81888 [Colletotrichum falcatum]